jgi:hypothetical protein
MNFSNTLGWVLLVFMAIGSGVLGGAIMLYLNRRRRMIEPTNYLLDKLGLLESDLRRASEDIFLIREYLYRKGLVDEEDLALLRRKLIELPRQMEAERAELIKGALEKDKEEQLVRDVPDTLH